MDTEQSDEEWNEDMERQAVRSNRALGGFRLSRQKSMSLDRNRSGSHNGLHSQEQEPFGVKLSRSSSGENVLEDNQDKEKERLSTCSCSCGRSSGCKTNKCECKAAGGLCGSGCGCKAGKCNNREALEVEEEPSSVANSVQMEMAETVASVGVDQTQRRFNDPGETGKPSSGVEVGEHVTKRAERLLAVHVATLLESAWKEETQNAEVQEEVDYRDASRDGEDEVVAKKPQRRALKDIGNTKVNVKGRPIAKQRRRQTALIQLVPIPPPPSSTSGIAATASALAAATAAAAIPNTVPANVPVVVPELVSPLWRQQSLQRRNNSPQLSPLRVRANKVGDSNSGVGSSNDDAGATKNVKAGNSSGSPTGPARVTDEKENIQRNSFV
ncbi:hypothetical protein AXG93_1052s1050 [Marchantia polymorpha subsp. ruderalis]|uniref:Tesmin/TSO1-like CXC domain-containing protein n=1 Tax=Marchantia polymorpha subsp. ruderalis TaxID=1480154 RepID=A0A176VVG2_MARPO|nr:hypothetical protein AXG93_1052s1050 [Marchantia polymorpha subsp. ruderalis]